jgi:LuxR family maltose regulon positive regulatory protein
VHSHILATKLFIPPLRANLVSRPRLLECLQLGGDSKLTLISAPAGYGKTTLLSAWVRQLDQPVAWYSLDNNDNDCIQFCDYIIAAVQSIVPNFGQTIPNLRGTSGSVAGEGILPFFINEFIHIPGNLLLILDDYHSITSDEVHQALLFLIENQPPNMHIVIASRTDPPLRISRLRAKGILREIRARDLGFSQAEAVELFNGFSGLTLNLGDIKTLVDKTEGWAVGLQLAALSMQAYQDKGAFVRAFAGDDRHVADYLFEEVLLSLPEHIQSFLLKTSILDRQCAPLCQALTGQDDSREILDMLETANLFLIPLDNRRHWYRYHHLFAEMLQMQLQRKFPVDIPALHRKASTWYESNDVLNQAIIHSIEAGDIERVEEFVKVNTFGMLEVGESATVSGWLNSLPQETVQKSLWLTVARGWTLMMTGNIKAGEAALRNLEDMVADPKFDDDQIRNALGQIAALKSYIADLRGDPLQVEIYAKEALDKLSQEDPLPIAIAAMMLATSYNRRGDTRNAKIALQDALTVCETMPYSFASIDALCMYSKIQFLDGKLHESAATLKRAFDISRENIRLGKRRYPISGLIHVYQSCLLYEWNQMEEALREMREGLRILEPCGYTECVIVGLINMTLIYNAWQDYERAFRTIDKAKHLSEKLPYWYPRVITIETWLMALQGNTQAADEWLAAKAKTLHGEIELHRGLEYRYFAKIQLILGRPDKAINILHRLVEATQERGATDRLIRGLVIQALTLSKNGERVEACNCIRRALKLAEPGGYVRVFLDEGEAAARLIYQVTQQGFKSAYCQQLLGKFSKQTPVRMGEPETSRELVEPLSGREIEVLKYIADGRTNQEIAQELILSLYTVKSHARNIYSKLGVKNRTEAVSRARLLGLLSQD